MKAKRSPFKFWRAPIVLMVALLVAWMASSSPAQAGKTWNRGDVFVGVAGGTYQVYDNNGNFRESFSSGGGFTTGCAFNPTLDKFYGTFLSQSVIKVFNDAPPHNLVQTIVDPDTGANESIVFAQDGRFFVGHPFGGVIHEWSADGLTVTNHNVAPATITNGTDWIDLAANQTTLTYVGEGSEVKRFDTVAGQLADFAPLGTGSAFFAHRILPPGDLSAGLIIANLADIKRLNNAANVVQTYDVAGHDLWFAMNFDPNGTSFWAADLGTSNFFRFNIASGAVEVGPINTGTGSFTLFGLCLKGEPTAALASAKIDLKPESNPNCVNPDAGGLAAVAIFSTDTVDATAIDESTVVFGDANATRCRFEDVPMEGPEAGQFMEPDGILDIVCKFRVRDVTWPAEGEDCGSISLSAETFDGEQLTGSDVACLAGEESCNAGVPLPLD